MSLGPVSTAKGSRNWIRRYTCNATVANLSFRSRKSWKERLLWDQAGVGFDRELLAEAGKSDDSLSSGMPVHSLDHAEAHEAFRSCI